MPAWAEPIRLLADTGHAHLYHGAVHGFFLHRSTSPGERCIVCTALKYQAAAFTHLLDYSLDKSKSSKFLEIVYPFFAYHIPGGKMPLGI